MRKDLPLSFRSGLSLGRGHCRVVAQIDELVRLGSTDTEVYEWSVDRGWSSFTLNWLATRIAAAPPRQRQVCIGGLDGHVCVDDGGSLRFEQIDMRVKGVRAFGDLRDFRTIGQHTYACGMSRQVYRRGATGDWVAVDAGTRQSPGDLAVAGFNAIDGLDEAEIFAAGFGGEIWAMQRGVWQAIDSPTNVVLHRIRTVSPDMLFACGQEGVLLRGAVGETWEIVEHDSTNDELWGMEWFGGRLFLASDEVLYELVDGNRLQVVDVGLGDFTFGELHAAHGALWSFGTKHLAWTDDAVIWHDITPRRRAD